VATVLGLLAAGQLVLVPTATAAAPPPLAGVVNGAAPGQRSGTADDYVRVEAPEACDAKATRHVTTVVGVVPQRSSDRSAAREWVGDNLYATSSVGLPGPVTVEASATWAGLADAFGQDIVPGTYRFVLRCQDSLGREVYDEWSGGVVFRTARSWTGFVGAGPTAGSSADSRSSGGSSASGTSDGSTGSGGPTTGSPTPSAAATSGGSTAPEPTAAATDDAAALPVAAGDDDPLAGTGASVRGVLVAGLLLLAAGTLVLVLRRRADRRDHPEAPWS
jgi:hypothetical protein